MFFGICEDVICGAFSWENRVKEPLFGCGVGSFVSGGDCNFHDNFAE
jgi:hypothetical protein